MTFAGEKDVVAAIEAAKAASSGVGGAGAGGSGRRTDMLARLLAPTMADGGNNKDRCARLHAPHAGLRVCTDSSPTNSLQRR